MVHRKPTIIQHFNAHTVYRIAKPRDRARLIPNTVTSYLLILLLLPHNNVFPLYNSPRGDMLVHKLRAQRAAVSRYTTQPLYTYIPRRSREIARRVHIVSSPLENNGCNTGTSRRKYRVSRASSRWRIVGHIHAEWRLTGTSACEREVREARGRKDSTPTRVCIFWRSLSRRRTALDSVRHFLLHAPRLREDRECYFVARCECKSKNFEGLEFVIQ